MTQLLTEIKPIKFWRRLIQLPQIPTTKISNPLM